MKPSQHAAARWARPSCLLCSLHTLPAPSWIIHPFGWSNTHLLFILPPWCQATRAATSLWNLKGALRGALAGLQYATLCNSGHCGGICINWIGIYQVGIDRENEFKAKLRFLKIIFWCLLCFSGSGARPLSAELFLFWRRQQFCSTATPTRGKCLLAGTHCLINMNFPLHFTAISKHSVLTVHKCKSQTAAIRL